MKVHFWGVRGSIPSPLKQSELKEKISAIIEQIRLEDIKDQPARERFLNGLPPWLFGTVGGNTPCVSVSAEGFEEPIIFDCGSGLREMGISLGFKKNAPKKYHIIFSHFHWDHVQGLPFFNPAYSSDISIDFYSPNQNLEDFLSSQMKYPYFPVKLENMLSNKRFISVDSPFSIGPVQAVFRAMNHPGGCFSYKLTHNGKSVIYATDTELSSEDFLKNDENTNYFQNADLIILDSQYTLSEATEKYKWGHSAFNQSVEFAASWGIKRLMLFHHDPAYNDQKVFSILQSAQWQLQEMNIKELEVSLAYEGLEITL